MDREIRLPHLHLVSVSKIHISASLQISVSPHKLRIAQHAFKMSSSGYSTSNKVLLHAHNNAVASADTLQKGSSSETLNQWICCGCKYNNSSWYPQCTECHHKRGQDTREAKCSCTPESHAVRDASPPSSSSSYRR